MHKSNTALICKITGEIMNENNPPMMVPSGCIYSEKALKQQALENSGYVLCPKTKTKYKFDKCKKVFTS